MTTAQLANSLYSLDVKVDEIICLAGNAANMGSALNSFLKMELDKVTAKRLFGSPHIPEEPNRESYEAYAAALIAKGFTGFLVRLWTPVPSYITSTPAYNEGGYTSSWGHSKGKWIYMPAWDNELLLEEAKAFHREVHRSAVKKRKDEVQRRKARKFGVKKTARKAK